MPYSDIMAPFVPTTLELVNEMLELAKLKPGEILVDLGCGDGRILCSAAKIGATAIGIEIDRRLIRLALDKAKALGVEWNVHLILVNLLNVDLSRANVVTMYLTTFANEEIRPKLERELRHGTRVVSHDFPIAKWYTKEILNFNEIAFIHTLFLYVLSIKETRIA